MSERSCRRPLAALAVVGTLCVLLAACGSGGSGGDGDGGLKLESVVSATGAGSFYGVATRQGMELAVKEINAAGGIKGKKVTVSNHDDASDPANAVNIVRGLQEDAELVVLNTITTVSTAVVPLLNGAQVPAVGPQISVPELVQKNRPYTFTFFPALADGAKRMITAWMKDEGVKNVVLVQDEADVPSKTQADLAAETIAQNGGVVTERISAPTGKLDYDSIISTIRSKRPDGVYISTLSNDAAGLVKQLGRAGLDVAKAMSIASFDPTALAGAGDGADGTYSFTYYLPSASPAAKKFAADFKRAYGSVPVMQAALSYAMTKAIAGSLRSVDLQSGGLDEKRTRIKDAIADIRNFRSPSGPITMGKDGVASLPPTIVTWSGGNAVPVKE